MKTLSELADSERVQLLVDAVRDYAIYLLDPAGRVATWNPGAERYKGYSAQEILGSHVSRFYTPEDQAAGLPERALRLALEQGRFESEGWRVRKDGSRYWAHVVIDPVRDDAGAHIGYAKVTRDITERRQAQEELERSRQALAHAQKMEAIGRLTGGVAHDFNNLLTVIRSSADFLRRPDLTPEKRERYVDAIAQTADRAAALTRQLLAFARRQPLQPEIFDVGARLSGLRQILETTVGSAVTLDIELPAHPLVIEADPVQFDTAILNMLVNARDAMPRGGGIILSGRDVQGVPAVRGHAPAQGAFVAVAIADTGSGIEPETLGRIFEPFFTTKPTDKGTGLGLSQVYGFAKQSGGEVDVASEIGRGATFTLYLPQSPHHPAPKAARLNVGIGPTPSRSILLVEDNEGVGRFARGLLEELGQSVTWAGDGQSALTILADRRADFDLVFSDVVMPGISGVELAREIQARWPDLEVVLTSGYSHVLVEEASHGFQLLHKLYSVENLIAALRVVPPSA